MRGKNIIFDTKDQQKQFLQKQKSNPDRQCRCQ